MLAEDDPVKQQMDIVDEQLDTTCRVFMALTMGCARCHDHKFDPFDMSDYYALAGIFKSTRTMLSHRVDSKWNATGLGDNAAALRLDDLEQIIDRHDNLLVNGNPDRMDAGVREAHTKLLEEAKREYAAIPKAMAVVDGAAGRPRGLPAGQPSHARAARAPAFSRDPRRAATSRQSTPSTAAGSSWRAGSPAPRHPLTARVIVNRVWRWHFGRGLVGSVDNFGRLGQLPTHPELLDWLANRLVDQGWSLKTAAQGNHAIASLSDEHPMEPACRPRSILRIPFCGECRAAGWKPKSCEIRSWPRADCSIQRCAARSCRRARFRTSRRAACRAVPSLYESSRRSVYLPVLRGALYEVYRTFDFPDPAVSSGDRAVTTVAAQALFMMNSPIVERASASLAARSARRRPASNDRDRHGTRMPAHSRAQAAAEELDLWAAFLERYQAAPPSRPGKIAATVASRPGRGSAARLLSSNEFVYVE